MLKPEQMLKQMTARLEKMQQAKSSHVVVGVLDGKYDDNTPVVTVAAAHEFGTERMPRRSFLRDSFEEKKDRIDAVIGSQLKKALENEGYTIEIALGIVGTDAVNHAKLAFRNNGYGKWTPLQPNYYEFKKSKGLTNTLIFTTKLRESIKWEVR